MQILTFTYSIQRLGCNKTIPKFLSALGFQQEYQTLVTCQQLQRISQTRDMTFALGTIQILRNQQDWVGGVGQMIMLHTKMVQFSNEV